MERLRDARLVEGDEFTAAGEQLRADIEWCTDQQERPIVQALGADAEELLGLLEPMADAVLAAGGYPADPRLMTRP